MAKKLALGSLIALVVAAVFYFNLSEDSGLGTAIGFQKEEIPVVDVRPVARADVSATVTAPGSVAALREISLHSLIQGHVLSIAVKEGQEVKQGDLLLQLDDHELKSDLKLAELDLAREKAQKEEQRIAGEGAAREVDAKQKSLQEDTESTSDAEKAAADLATARTRRDGAKEKWDRYRNATGVSEEDRDRARNEFETAEKQLQAAEAAAKQTREGKERKLMDAHAALDQARSRLDAAKARFASAEELVKRNEESVAVKAQALEKAVVRSPMDGIVTRVNVSPNDMVTPGSMKNPGTVLVTVSDLSSILVNADIDEIDVVNLAKGQKASVAVEALAGVSYVGEVSEIASTAEPKEGGNIAVFRTRILVREPKASLKRLRPGLSAHVEILTETHKDVIAIPIQAVVRRALARVARKSGEPAPVNDAEAEAPVQVVFLAERERAVVRRVKTGISDDARVELLEDSLKTGEVLITGPYRVLEQLRNGDRVRVRESK